MAARSPSPPAAADDTTVRHAAYLALGSLAGRILGLLREITITRLFGQTGQVSAFTVASQIPIMLHDLLVGGYVSAAFIPVLAARHEQDSPADFSRLVSALLFVMSLVLLLTAALMALGAPWLARWMAGGFARYDVALLDLTSGLVRMMGPVLWLTGMAGILNAILFAMRRFAWPAVANALFNLGIVALAPFLADTLGVHALVVGLGAGLGLQALLLTQDLGRARIALKRVLWHPGLRDILWRYLPIVLGLLVSQIQIFADRRLASGTGVSSIAWMRTGTTLQQLPLGLITISAGLATLPVLSRAFERGDVAEYRTRLLQGLAYVALLMVPVLLFMAVLGEPLIRMLFLRGEFTARDVGQVLAATRVYLLGAFFAAMDHLLNNAFYARKNTVLPTVVGIGSVVLYFAAALTLTPDLNYMGLVWADTLKHAGHMLVMLVLVCGYSFTHWRDLPRVLGPLLAKIAVAAGVATVVVWRGQASLAAWLPSSLWGDLVTVGASGVGGFLVYGLGLHVLQVPELQAVGNRMRRIVRMDRD